MFMKSFFVRSSTADRSPCTVATIWSPLLHPCHTHGHAIPLVNLRSLSVVASSSSYFCASSRVPYKLYCNSPHMCASPALYLLAASQRILSFVMERRTNTPFARRPSPRLFLHVHPCSQRLLRRRLRVQLWSCACLGIPSRPSRVRWASLVVPCQSPPILS